MCKGPRWRSPEDNRQKQAILTGICETEETNMKVLGISGNPRRDGNTDILVNVALEVLAGEGLQTEFLSLADRPIKPCVSLPRLFCLGYDPLRSGRSRLRGNPGQVCRGGWHLDWLAGILRVGHAADHGFAGPGRLMKRLALAADCDGRQVVPA